MKAKIPLILLLVLLIIIAGLHALGIYFHIYWQLKWFDIPIHILGALWVSIMLLSLVIAFVKTNLSNSKLFIIGLIGSVVVGILWEYFELKTGSTLVTQPELFPDTIGDTIANIIGGSLGAWLSIRRNRVLPETNVQ